MVRLLCFLTLMLAFSGCEILLGTYFSPAGSLLEGEIDLSDADWEEDSGLMMTTLETGTAGGLLLVRFMEKNATRGTMRLYRTGELSLLLEFTPSDDWACRVISTLGNSLYSGQDLIQLPEGTRTRFPTWPTVPGGTSDFYRLNYVADEGSFYALPPGTISGPALYLAQRLAWNDQAENIVEYPFPGGTFTPLALVQNRFEGQDFTLMAQGNDGTVRTFSLSTSSGVLSARSSMTGNFRLEDRRFLFLTRTAVVLPLDQDGLGLQAFDNTGGSLGVVTLSNSERDNSLLHFDQGGTYWYQFDKIQKRIRQYRTWW